MQALWSSLHAHGPQLVVLLVSSPLIGAAIVAALGPKRLDAARQAAVGNGWLTVILSLLVAMAFATRPESERSFSAVLPWFAVEHPDGGDGSRLFLACVLSLGVDALNLGPLTWIPWLAGGVIGRKATASAAELIIGLLLEFALLAVFAAFDAVTFLFAGMMAVGLIGLHLGWWGLGERRLAAARFWRGQFAAQVLWTVGLVGMAVAAAWSRQELLARIPPVDFRWMTLARGLPQVVMQSMAGFQYWQAASSLLFAVILTGVLVRGPWPPFHRGLQTLIDTAPAASAPLLITAWSLVAGYAWLRFIVPAFGDDLAAIDGEMMWWTAITTAVAARLCWTATDLRQFAAAWCLSLHSLGWLGLIDGSPAGLTAGWLMMQAAGWSTAGWLLLAERTVGRRLLAMLFAGLCALPFVTIPVWGGDAATTPVRAVLVHHLEPTGLALMGWFITGWAAVRRIAGLMNRSTNRDAEDAATNGWSFLPLGVCLAVVVFFPAWWWGQP